MKKKKQRRKTHRRGKQFGDCPGGGRWREEEESMGGLVVLDGDMTWGGEHIVQCTDDVLWNSAPETCTIFFTSVTPIHSIKMKKQIKKPEQL